MIFYVVVGVAVDVTGGGWVCSILIEKNAIVRIHPLSAFAAETESGAEKSGG